MQRIVVDVTLKTSPVFANSQIDQVEVKSESPSQWRELCIDAALASVALVSLVALAVRLFAH